MLHLEKENIYICSDSHAWHPNLVKGSTKWRVDDGLGNKVIPLEAVRDFENEEIMTETLIKNINYNVKENDTLFHLGDWGFGGFENVARFRKRINCRNIHFLIGNHDHHIENNKGNVKSYFRSVNNYLEVEIGPKSDNKSLVLCHYPIVSWNHLRKGTLMLHGHQHLKGDKRFGNGKRMDVGFCGSPEFRPYHLDEVFSLLKDKESFEVGLDNRKIIK